MKNFVACAVLAALLAAPLASYAASHMIHVKGLQNMVPEFMSEDELAAGGGSFVSNAVYSYQGALYVEYDFDKKLYRVSCCDGEAARKALGL